MSSSVFRHFICCYLWKELTIIYKGRYPAYQNVWCALGLHKQLYGIMLPSLTLSNRSNNQEIQCFSVALLFLLCTFYKSIYLTDLHGPSVIKYIHTRYSTIYETPVMYEHVEWERTQSTPRWVRHNLILSYKHKANFYNIFEQYQLISTTCEKTKTSAQFYDLTSMNDVNFPKEHFRKADSVKMSEPSGMITESQWNLNILVSYAFNFRSLTLYWYECCCL